MIASSNKLGLSSDRCYNHIISNILELALKQLPERFFTIISNAAILHMSSKWKEFFNRTYKHDHEELVLRTNFRIGNDTRWGTKLEECLDLLLFEDAITQFYKSDPMLESSPKKILQSDFDFIRELREIFNLILIEIKNLQSSENAHRISVFAFSLLKIASAADQFIENEEQKREILQTEFNQKHQENPQNPLLIAVPSHFLPFFQTIKDSIINQFILSKKECEMRMKAALILDPAIPMDTIPDFYQEEHKFVLNWIAQQTQSRDPRSQQQESSSVPFHLSQLNTPPSSQIDAETNSNALEYFLMHIRDNHYTVTNPWKFWCSQPNSPLKGFALDTFAHHVSNASLEGFFSSCKTIIGLNGNSMSNTTLEVQALLSANRDILDEKIIEPIKMKYNN